MNVAPADIPSPPVGAMQNVLDPALPPVMLDKGDVATAASPGRYQHMTFNQALPPAWPLPCCQKQLKICKPPLEVSQYQHAASAGLGAESEMTHLPTQVAEGRAGAPAGGPAAETRAAACRHLGTQAAVAQAAAAASAAAAGPPAVPEEAC